MDLSNLFFKINYRIVGFRLNIINFILKRFLPNNFKKTFNFNYEVFYNKRYNSYLSNLCVKYGSDKGSNDNKKKIYNDELRNAHNYTDFYSLLFDNCRTKFKKVFECGIGKNNTDKKNFGPSLRVWRDYFPNAIIYAADIDKNLIFNEKRIKSYHCDQTSKKSIKIMWNKIKVRNFDLIIDDGLHRFEAGRSFFENSYDKLAKGGIYIIEDVRNRCLTKYKNYFKDKNIDFQFILLKSKKKDVLPYDQSDNNLILIRK